MAILRRTRRKVNYICADGPFQGQVIALSNETLASTMYFSVSSFHNGRRGRYVPSKESNNAAVWEWENEAI